MSSAHRTEGARLLERCSESLEQGVLDVEAKRALHDWSAGIEARTRSTAERFLATPLFQWEDLILKHEASGHRWYDLIAEEISVDEMARFLLENRYYPVFLSLLRAIERIQICAEGRRAVTENIEDESHPVPHAQLMWRMMEAVRRRTGPLELAVYPTLIDRTLVFYYGYYCDPWHLVGSVFATERLGAERVRAMDRGLRRLGLDDEERAFTVIHSECDDHHASDWLERVIIPSAYLQSEVRVPIARGIAACLDTSVEYLDFLHRRICS